MLKRTLLAALLTCALLVGSASARCFNDGPGQGQTCTSAAQPAPLTGFGTLAVTTASAAISTMTVGPNSPAFPMPGAALTSGYVGVRNSINSANTAYVCWLGGTCTSSVGEPLAVGESMTRNLGTQTIAPTVISGSTSTLFMSW